MKGFTPLHIKAVKDFNVFIKKHGNASSRIDKKKRFLYVTGFTLIEVLVAVLIFSIIVLSVFAVFNAGGLNLQLGEGWLQIQQQARQGMERMVKGLREARNVAIVDNGDNDIAQFDNFAENGVQYLRDPLNNTALILRNASGDVRLANNVNSLNFCWWHDNSPNPSTCDNNRLSSDILQIQVGVSKTVMQRNIAFTWTEKVRLRNE